MAGVTESNNWSPEVYRFETEDVVEGGEDGLDNLPGKQLAGRTNWLRLMLTAVCAAEGVTVLDNETTQFLTAIDSRIGNAISALVDSSPAALDTLNELAAALGDDPNFATTVTTALSLKAKWSALDHIITAAGMTPDHDDDAKLKSALDYLYNGGQAVRYYATGTALPVSNIGPIWHADYNSIMTWQAFTANGAAYTGYASVQVGSLLLDAQSTPRTGYVKNGTSNLNRTTYAALRGWAMHNGIMVASGVWAAGQIAVCDNVDGTTFKIYDVRGEFPRFWDDARGADVGRNFGSWQSDAIRNITGYFYATDDNTSLSAGAFHAGGVAGNGAGGASTEWQILFDASRVVPTAAENRSRNTAFAGMVKF